MKGMIPDLELGVKQAIRYTVKSANVCGNCRHKKVLDGEIDRTWYSVCTKFDDTLGTMTVSDEAKCDLWEKKP